jgi:hypothetical protein
MAQAIGGTAWYRLTPDDHGSYVNGTWTTLAPMEYSRLWYGSQVLTDGRVFVAGGEDGGGGSNAEVYDPVHNHWTLVTDQSGVKNYSDCISEMLPDGTVLVAPDTPSVPGGTVIYNPATNAISPGPVLYRGYNQDEASWVKLPDNSILTIDPDGEESERYVPSLAKWVNDGPLPAELWDAADTEMGAALLLPSGRAFFLGSTGETALYTPSGTTAPGTWTAGAAIPGGYATYDAPAAMLVTGNELCAFAPGPSLPSTADETEFFEYDTASNSFSPVSGAPAYLKTWPAYSTFLLDLPDGSALLTRGWYDVFVYRPTGIPMASGKPTITSIVQNSDGSFHLTGTLLDGISEGAAYGDDAQMSTNRPLVRVTDSKGLVSYARTYQWSSTGVFTGNTLQSTEFSQLPIGSYSLVVVANGIASDPFQLTVGPPGRDFEGVSVNQTAPSNAVTAGAPVAMSIHTASGYTYQWFDNGIAIPGATGGTYFPGQTHGSSTGVVTTEDTGSYTVRVTDPSGKVGYLGLGTLIVVAAQPSSQSIETGGTVVFSVEPGNYELSELTYRWQLNGVSLSDGNGITGSTGPQLLVQGASTADRGSYTCILGYGDGSANTVSATLTVSSPSTPGTVSSISTRAFVGEKDQVLLGGFRVAGSRSATVLVQAIGPGLSAPPYDVVVVLQHPTLSVHQNQNGKDVVLYSNTGWGSSSVVSGAAHAVGALPVLQPGSADSELLVTLPPGEYTAEVSGVNGGTGIALCAIRQLP